MLAFYSGNYTALTVFPSMEPDMRERICLTDGQTVLQKTASRFARLQFPLEPDREYTLHMGGATIGLAYLHEGADMETRGVQFLQEEKPKYRFHFSPSGGYLGGPAALCFYKGKYHMFYMWNPFTSGEEIVCWGHAAGESLFHMHSLPVLFLPPAELCLSRYRTGGVFDGKAMVEENTVALYFTRRIYDYSGRCLSSGRMRAQTRDMLHFSEEESIPVLYDVPFAVAGMHGKSGGVYLCTQDENGQTVQKRLLREKEGTPFLYADFFRTGRSHALITAAAASAGEWYRGTFSGEKFRVRSRGKIEYGDFCAPQTFFDGSRRILMGKVGENAISMPRKMESRGGRLCMTPLGELYEKFGGEKESDAFLVRMAGEGDMTAQVGPLRCAKTENELVLQAGERTWRLPIAARQIELFFDGELVEVFVNGGEAVCSLVLPNQAGSGEMAVSAHWTLSRAYLKG